MAKQGKKLTPTVKKVSEKPSVGVYRFFSIFLILMIIISLGIGGYYFFEITEKTTEEYVGVSLAFIGGLSFCIFIFYEFFIEKNAINNALFISELRKYAPGNFIMILLLIISYIVAIAIFIYYTISERPPFDIKYIRNCPYGTSSSQPTKQPAEYSN